MGSNVPHARELLASILDAGTVNRHDDAIIRQALKLMVRRSPVKRAKASRPRIDRNIRAEVGRLAALGKSNHEIAQVLNLRNGGRVSEILGGER